MHMEPFGLYREAGSGPMHQVYGGIYFLDPPDSGEIT